MPNPRRERGQISSCSRSRWPYDVSRSVVDGGNAMAQQRPSQNASDFAALAGARVIAEKLGGDLTNGIDANVKAAIDQAIALNSGTPMLYGAANNGPQYVDKTGAVLGYVGDAAAIPANSVGVNLGSTRVFKPYFLGIVGIQPMDGVNGGHRQGRVLYRGATPGHSFQSGSRSRSSRHTRGAMVTSALRPGTPVIRSISAGNLNVPGRIRVVEIRMRRVWPWPGSSREHRRVCQLQAVPPERDRASLKQLRMLHSRATCRERRQDREPSRKQSKRRLLVVHR